MRGDLQPGRLADQLVAGLSKNKSTSLDTNKKALFFGDQGTEKPLENSLDAAKKVASQTLEEKIKKTCDTRSAI
eukprot:366537-Pelagomonas_calceolata.AAC.1